MGFNWGEKSSCNVLKPGQKENSVRGGGGAGEMLGYLLAAIEKDGPDATPASEILLLW